MLVVGTIHSDVSTDIPVQSGTSPITASTTHTVSISRPSRASGPPYETSINGRRFQEFRPRTGEVAVIVVHHETQHLTIDAGEVRTRGSVYWLRVKATRMWKTRRKLCRAVHIPRIGTRTAGTFARRCAAELWTSASRSVHVVRQKYSIHRPSVRRFGVREHRAGWTST